MFLFDLFPTMYNYVLISFWSLFLCLLIVTFAEVINLDLSSNYWSSFGMDFLVYQLSHNFKNRLEIGNWKSKKILIYIYIFNVL